MQIKTITLEGKKGAVTISKAKEADRMDARDKFLIAITLPGEGLDENIYAIDAQEERAFLARMIWRNLYGYEGTFGDIHEVLKHVEAFLY